VFTWDIVFLDSGVALMTPTRVGVFLASASLFLVMTAQLVQARMAAPPPPASRVGAFDCVVVGKVLNLEKRDIEATRFPGQPKVKYRVAVVEVNDAILGTKDKKIRVG